MKQSWYVAFGLALATLCTPLVAGQPQSAQVMFEAARKADTIDGNPKEAIAQYELIVKRFPNDRAIVADALVRMAGAYRKLGDKQATAIYQRVVKEFSDQTAATAEARAALGGSGAVNASSTTYRKVWAGPGVDSNGGVSPDGRFLSFVDWDTGDLALHDLATGTDRRLTNKGPWADSEEFAESSAISRDGRYVAYAYFNGRDRYEVRVADLKAIDATAHRRLFERSDMEWVGVHDWSPDGQWIAVVFGLMDRSTHIGLLSIKDGSLRVLRTSAVSSPSELSFSPDGRYLAFDSSATGGTQERRDVFVIALEGGDAQILAGSGAYNALVGWTPDGSSVLFVSGRSGMDALWSQAVRAGRKEGDPRLLKSGIGDVSLGMTSSGSLFVGVSAATMDISVTQVDLVTGKRMSEVERPIQRRVGSNRNPDWSPDGRYLLHTTTRRRGRNDRTVAVRDMQSGDIRELSPDLRTTLVPRWSPDGTAILAQGVDNTGKRGIFRIASDTGATMPIVLSGPGVFLHTPSWSPDGRRIFYTRSGNDNTSVAVERDLSTGSEREIPGSQGFQGFTVSPNGTQLAVPRRNRDAGRSELLVLPVAGGAPRVVHSVKLPELLVWAGWTPDSRRLLVKHVCEAPECKIDEALSVPLDGTAPVRLDLPGVRWGTMRVHPDGARVAYLAGHQENEVWVLENFLPATAKSAKK